MGRTLGCFSALLVTVVTASAQCYQFTSTGATLRVRYYLVPGEERTESRERQLRIDLFVFGRQHPFLRGDHTDFAEHHFSL